MRTIIPMANSHRKCRRCGRHRPLAELKVSNSYARCAERCEVPPDRRVTYRPLGPDEPDPPTDPLVYTSTDGRLIQRWKIGKRQFVERVVRDENGRSIRMRPYRQKRVDVGEIVRLYNEGFSQPDVARALGCDAGTVSRALGRAGMRGRTVRERRPDPDAAEVVRLYVTERFSVKDVAVMTGLGTRGARRILSENGVKIRGVGRKSTGPSGPSYESEFQQLRPLVRQRSGGRCEAQLDVCTRQAQHCHHRKRRSQGGDNSMANVLDLCRRCHDWIHGHPLEATALGLLVPSWGDPSTVAVRPDLARSPDADLFAIARSMGLVMRSGELAHLATDAAEA